MFLFSTFKYSSIHLNQFKNYSSLKAKKKFSSINYDSTKNDRIIIFYPEFLGIEYEHKNEINSYSLNKIISMNILKTWAIIYTTSICFLFPEQILIHLITVTNCICKICFFLFLFLIAKRFFLKILKYSKFTNFLIIILFLFILLTITDYFLKINKIFNKNLFITMTVEFLILKDLWIDKYFNLEIKNSFFIDSIIYKRIKTVITVIFSLDLIFRIYIYYPILEKFQSFLPLSELKNFATLFVYSNNELFFNKTINSTYSLLILSLISCIIIFLYYIAFYKKKKNLTNIKKLPTYKKYNFLSKNNQLTFPLCRFLFLENKNDNLLLFEKLIVYNNNRDLLEEKKRWIIKKNAISIPFGIILYANEFQVTKQKIWYEIKNKKS
jgi:hypothetical protein